ncbi:ISNCY family transposase, partial [Pseudomonas aeruginosa]|nr:ISNCY family transposase [Pseudomonas aeruginosa]
GRISVESVVRCSWNGWPDDRGIRKIDQGAIVENKRLGHVLQVAQLVQAQRDSRRSQSVPGNPRQSTQGKMLSKKAQRELMPEDIAAALDNTPPSRRSRHA